MLGPAPKPTARFLGVLFLSFLGFSTRADRIPWTQSRVVGSPEPPPICRVERIFPKLSFPEPTDLVYDPASQRWFVGLLGGRVFTFANNDGVLSADLAGDLRKSHPNLIQFLSFALHPGFSTNHLLYTVFTEGAGKTNRWVLGRFHVTTGTTPALDTSSETTVFTTFAGGHDGACVRFGPDGMLYASLGDGSSPEPPDALHTGQDLSDYLSSIIRLDVDHPSGEKPYGVPTDNPFLKHPGARPEIWAYGFRNPWRMNFGPDGALWVGDVGWELWEMIHRVTRGYNAGWSVTEGPQLVYGELKPPTPIHPAISVHAHSEADSITGGLFYRGDRMPRLKGAYIYGDWTTGKIWALRNDGDRLVSREELCDTTLQIVSFAEGPDREVVILDHRGESGLYRLLPNETGGSSVAFPKKLSETGLFSDTRLQTPSPGVLAYRIQAEMWQDHATSERWVAVPGTNVIWNGAFPLNTVFAKTYSMEMEAGKVSSRRKLETQLLHQSPEGWQAYSYRWNPEQTDAELVPLAGASENIRIEDAGAPGGYRDQNWRFASRAECLRCHNPWSGNVLGFNIEQLQSRGKPSSGDFQSLLNGGVVAYEKLPDSPTAWPNPYGNEETLEERSRVWLHVNCAHCHRWGAGGGVVSYFNHDGKLTDLRLIDFKPMRGGFGLEDPKVIVPGHPERSVLWYRINTEGQGHMPHMGSRLVDQAGSRLLAEWIESMPGDPSSPKAAFDRTSGALAALRVAQKDHSTLPAAVQSSQASTNAFVRQIFEKFLSPEKRRKTLGEQVDSEQVLGLVGSPERGRILFAADNGPQCARCHQISGVGKTYGPDLTAIGRKYDRRTLLDQVIYPSKLIAPEFLLRTVETKDGQTFTGFAEGKSEAEIGLRVEGGTVVAIKRTDLVSESTSTISAMPEGLLSNLTAQEAADLLAYLIEGR
jgi:putative heme-binding domain-containing protein